MTYPEAGHRDKCERCGRTVWLTPAGTVGLSSFGNKGDKVYQWSARKGSKPNRRQCPVSDGWPMTYHSVKGQPTTIYRHPNTGNVSAVR